MIIKICTIVNLLFITNIYSQVSEEKLILFNDSTSSYNIQKIEINNSSGSSEVSNFEIILNKLGDSVFICKLIDLNSNKNILWTKETLVNLSIIFRITENNSLKIVSDNELTKLLKGDKIYLEFKQQNVLGEYEQLLHNPDFLFGLYFEEYLNIIKDFFYSDLTDYNREVQLQNMIDSIPGSESQVVLRDKNLIKVTRIISIDLEDVRDYLYDKRVNDLKNRNSKVKVNRSTIPIVDRLIKTTVIARRENDGYIVESIDFDHRYNLGNEYDRYIYIRIHRKYK